MAGTYPDVPGPRMSYDRDGSAGFFLSSGGSVSSLAAAQLEGGNDEDLGSWIDYHPNSTDTSLRRVGIIFPELRDVVGICIHAQNYAGWGNVETSNNTTNGLDGTWVSRGGTGSFVSAHTVETMRTGIISTSWTGVNAVRVGFYGGPGQQYFRTLHLYGEPSSGSAPDRLRFWEPTLAQEVDGAHFDWGDVSRSSSVTRDFRIHNPSASLTATSVTVTMEALTDTSPTNVGQHEFSTDGGATWASSATVGNLVPGATSGVITLRRVTSGSATLSLWWTRMVASAASWA